MADRKTKILYLITKSNWGGAQKHVFDLASNLPNDQFEVIVAAGGTGEKGAGSGQLVNKLQEKNIRTSIISSFTRDIFLFNELQAFWQVKKVLQRERPDVLHVNSSKAAGVGGFVGRILGVRNIIYTVHGWPFNEKRSAISRALIYFFSWLTCFLVHKVIVINQTNFEQGKRMWIVGRKMHLIYNGVAPISFLDKTEAREKLSETTSHNFSDTDLIVGTIAELHPNKNLDTLIRSITKDSPWQLLIIGDGQEKVNLQKLIQELGLENKVFLTGFLPSASTYLKAFDAFALVSKKEGLPYVILEAGHAGLPVIGSDIPGIRAIISSPDLGIITSPATPETITTALQKLTDPTLRLHPGVEGQTLGKNLQTKIQTEFSIEKMMKETKLLYTNLF